MKIHQTIITSSIWGEAHATRLVWITMLAMADADGVVQASVGGLARMAVVSREECEAALSTLLAEDPDDRSGVDAGRRIQEVPGGWLVTNHAAYRDVRTPQQVATAERVARHRAKSKEDKGVTR